MDGTGQTVVLANGIANVLGKVYIIFAPFVGLLGTFMTGSNMSSNILFGSFQMTTAKLLGANTAATLERSPAGWCHRSCNQPEQDYSWYDNSKYPRKRRRSYEKAYGDYNTGYNLDWSSIVCYDSFIRKS